MVVEISSQASEMSGPILRNTLRKHKGKSKPKSKGKKKKDCGCDA
jgi:hypothetical protein